MNVSFDIIGVLMCSWQETKTFSAKRKEKIVCIEPSMFQLVDGSSARRIESGQCSGCVLSQSGAHKKPNKVTTECFE